MPLTNAFRDYNCGLLTGTTSTLFNEANAHIGVGDGSAAFAASQTDLQGTNLTRSSMQSGFPNLSQGSNIMRFQASFGTAEANYAWNEWGIFNASSSGIMMNRRVESLGTKTNTQTWEFTTDVQINVS